MDRYRVLIATADSDESAELKNALEETGRFTVIDTVDSGMSCIHVTMGEKPDLVILNLLLRDLDGLEVLDRLGTLTATPPRTFVLSSHIRILNRQIDADGCALLPCRYDLIAQRALDVLAPPESKFSDDDIDFTVCCICQDINAPLNMKGYDCVRAGVRISIRQPAVARQSFIQLYPAIAEVCGVRAIHVERNLRNFVEGLYKSGNLLEMERYHLTTLARARSGNPNNTTFLKAMTTQVVHILRSREAAAGESLSLS